MKQLGILIALIASTSATAAPTAGASTAATTRSVAEFGGCFVAAQDRAGLAWSFVPKPHGGTFSNVGAKGATSPYFLAVSDRGAVRTLRLEPATPAGSLDARVTRAVSQCA